MSTQIRQIRFYEGRKHRFRKPKSVSLSGLSDEQIYEIKKEQRRRRAEEISNNSNLESYIQWIVTIQKKLNLTNAKFAERIGVSSQTVKLWKRKSGHFPSERSFKRLLELEMESRIQVTIVKVRYGVKM